MPDVRCRASTQQVYSASISDSQDREDQLLHSGNHRTGNVKSGQRLESNVFKTLEWSSDGTALLATSEDNVLRTFLVPVDLLAEGRDVAQPWLPTSSLQRPENIYSSALYPYFCLQDISTAILLSACASQPIHLHSALFPQLLASFPLIDPYTEAYITPHSLQFSRSGQSFAAGSNSLISIFDLTRPGDGPLLSLPTIPSRRSKVIGGGVGMKGIIATLDESHDGMLAAGTFTRWIGLYAQGGKGECIATWSLQGESGNGVSQVLWDKADARYLYVAERNSDEITVYDIRKTGRQVGRLLGRRATSNQRLQIGQVLSSSGPELHAGGLDGVCQAWKAPWVVNGDKMPDWCWQAHDDPVTAVCAHYTGAVLATSSGQRNISRTPQLREGGGANGGSQAVDMDNSLKLWEVA